MMMICSVSLVYGCLLPHIQSKAHWVELCVGWQLCYFWIRWLRFRGGWRAMCWMWNNLSCDTNEWWAGRQLHTHSISQSRSCRRAAVKWSGRNIINIFIRRPFIPSCQDYQEQMRTRMRQAGIGAKALTDWQVGSRNSANNWIFTRARRVIICSGARMGGGDCSSQDLNETMHLWSMTDSHIVAELWRNSCPI